MKHTITCVAAGGEESGNCDCEAVGLEDVVKICRQKILAPDPADDDYTACSIGETKLARRILDLLGELHGDEEKQARLRAAERLQQERDAAEYAEHVAKVAAENEKLEALKQKRIEVSNAAIRAVGPDFMSARGDRDTLGALEATLNAHAAGARREHNLGRMKISIDHAGNVGVAWEDE